MRRAVLAGLAAAAGALGFSPWHLAAVPVATGLAVLAGLWYAPLPALGWAAAGTVAAWFPHLAPAAGLAGYLAGAAAVGVNTGISQVVSRQQAHLARGEDQRRVVARNRDDALVAAELENRKLTDQLQHWVTHDPLTGLANRTLFVRLLHDRLAAGHQSGVLLISLAGFTEVNEQFGPAVGDQLLAAVAGRLGHAAREGDQLARVDGDVFGLLLTDLPVDHVPEASNRILATVRAPFSVEGHLVTLKTRAGCAAATADQGEAAGALEAVRRAEMALRGATPGGTVEVFTEELERDKQARLHLQRSLARALDGEEILAYYQPIVSAETGELYGAEALVRWQHPERGLVSPADFIPLAEQTGLIVPLGLRVLQLSLRQLRQWQQRYPDLTMAVNVSARQLAEPGLVEAVREVLWSSGVNPRHVVLEVTESLLVEDTQAAIATLWQLRGLGVRLAVDDFGTGYSSLSRLGEFPIDEMKVDQSFVSRLGATHAPSDALVAAAIAMGHGLGLTVVAEGVETPEQARALIARGCDLLQGYLLGRPLTTDAFTPLLGTRLFTPAAAAVVPVPRAAGDWVTPRPREDHVPALLPSFTPVRGPGRLGSPGGS
ncbi:MAG: putative bifunctional diguanylate cyclase/phosphodiesterase [Mycobacteriales bacterium]